MAAVAIGIDTRQSWRVCALGAARRRLSRRRPALALLTALTVAAIAVICSCRNGKPAAPPAFLNSQGTHSGFLVPRAADALQSASLQAADALAPIASQTDGILPSWLVDLDMPWMHDPIVSLVGWCCLLSGLVILRVASATEETQTPVSFLKSKDKDTSKNSTPPVVCLGDSITRGNLSADWVKSLRGVLPEGMAGSVLNAGVNMETSLNIQRRLDEIIACEPSHVTVLVGTNDMKGTMSPLEGFLYKFFGKLPAPPSLESYEATLVEIRDRLEAAGAQVALVSPPVLGEDINSMANQRAEKFADCVRRIAESGGERCTYLPFFEQTKAMVPEKGGQPYCGLQFFSWLCMLCLDIHVLQRDLAEVQRERRLGVTVDLVHLGPQAADKLAEMVADFVKATQGSISIEDGQSEAETVSAADLELAAAYAA
eukprot:TRINITY_DN112482_c0_g1_i1.p1 TRINITY_DN112482_c0_g1~~TRINITY_DN112482_c0_g1_i1.p1  ORF type:complete len:451 (+),score=98.27 TRINITY_DN112482_c0_g1_i1:70-1353(+)